MDFKYPHFSFNFHCYPKKRLFSIDITSNNQLGIIGTIYWKRQNIFNLVIDKGAPLASPWPHDHNWLFGIIRWSIGPKTKEELHEISERFKESC